MITAENKIRILSVLSIFETGHRDGDYDDVTVLKDATNDDGDHFYQITYGRHQTTEQSHLKTVNMPKKFVQTFPKLAMVL
jgi:chitosanase